MQNIPTTSLYCTNSPANYLSITQLPAMHTVPISTTQSIWHLYNTTQNTPLYKCSAYTPLPPLQHNQVRHAATTQPRNTQQHVPGPAINTNRGRPQYMYASIYRKAQKQNKQSQPSKRKAKRVPTTQLSWVSAYGYNTKDYYILLNPRHSLKILTHNHERIL